MRTTTAEPAIASTETREGQASPEAHPFACPPRSYFRSADILLLEDAISWCALRRCVRFRRSYRGRKRCEEADGTGGYVADTHGAGPSPGARGAASDAHGTVRYTVRQRTRRMLAGSS